MSQTTPRGQIRIIDKGKPVKAARCVLILMLTLLAIGCEGEDSPSAPLYAPQPGDERLTRGWLNVRSAEIVKNPGARVPYRLVVRGEMPTTCHSWRAVVRGPAAEPRFDVEMYSLVDPQVICIQMVGEFEGEIELPTPPPGRYEVRINGQRVAELVADHQ